MYQVLDKVAKLGPLKSADGLGARHERLVRRGTGFPLFLPVALETYASDCSYQWTGLSAMWVVRYRYAQLHCSREEGNAGTRVLPWLSPRRSPLVNWAL